MTRYLKLEEVLQIHQAVLKQSGGSTGIRDLGALKSALAQPQQSFGGEERFSSLFEKAAAYGFFITRNHPFVDGNKRVGHATMEVFLRLNNHEVRAGVDEQEQLMLDLASGDLSLEELTDWLRDNAVPTTE